MKPFILVALFFLLFTLPIKSQNCHNVANCNGYACAGYDTCVCTGYAACDTLQVPLVQQTTTQLQAIYDADMKQYWASDPHADLSALTDEIHALNVELDKRSRVSIQATTNAIEAGFAEVRHEQALKARVQAWHMFVNECQHSSWKHLWTHPSWCQKY